MFFKKSTKSYKIFTVDLTLSKRQNDDEDVVFFCGLPRKHELYHTALFLPNLISLCGCPISVPWGGKLNLKKSGEKKNLKDLLREHIY